VDVVTGGAAIPVTPPEARTLFGDRVALAEVYAGLLAGPGIERGLIGPREAVRLWDRHILNCAVVAELIPHRATVCDIGSGAGLPGLVLAMVRPDVEVTLVEPLLRRATYLRECVDHLGLERVTVTRARAEELHGSLVVDLVTARAVAPLDRLASWSLPLLGGGGRMLALKGAAVADEVEAATPTLRSLGAESWTVTAVGAGIVDPPTTVVQVRLPTDHRPATPTRSSGATARRTPRRNRPRRRT
jgi:16S rRNA (guanine527-N7)-methyltransferase